MADEKKTAAPATAKVAVKKTDEKQGIFKRIVKWFRDMKRAQEGRLAHAEADREGLPRGDRHDGRVRRRPVGL